MARTVAQDPLQKFKFRVNIQGVPTGMGFQKVSGLSSETEVIEYFEAGFTHAHKLAGREKVGDIVLEKGMYASKDMEDLYKKTLTDPSFRGTMNIEIMDKLGNVARSYTLAEAWASKWESSDLDATSSDVAIEKVTLQFEHFI